METTNSRMKSLCDEENAKLEFLYSAIQDVQETIRFTDTKSGTIIVLGTALIAAIVTLIDKYVAALNKLDSISKAFLIVGFILFCLFLLIAIFLSLKSINPSNNPEKHIELGNLKYEPKIKYYLSGVCPSMKLRDYFFENKNIKFSISAQQYNESLEKCDHNDLQTSLVYEFLKLSYIKEKKLKRTQSSLKWIEICIWTAVITTILVISANNTYFTKPISFNVQTGEVRIFTGLLTGYFLARLITVFLKYNKEQSDKWKSIFLNSTIYMLVIGVLMLMLSNVSIVGLITIFLSYSLIDKVLSEAFMDNLSKQINYKLFFTIDDLLHISILTIITLLKL